MSKLITSIVLAVVAHSIMTFVSGFNPSAPVMLVTMGAAVVGLLVG
jgi:hypothetical protein